MESKDLLSSLTSWLNFTDIANDKQPDRHTNSPLKVKTVKRLRPNRDYKLQESNNKPDFSNSNSVSKIFSSEYLEKQKNKIRNTKLDKSSLRPKGITTYSPVDKPISLGKPHYVPLNLYKISKSKISLKKLAKNKKKLEAERKAKKRN